MSLRNRIKVAASNPSDWADLKAEVDNRSVVDSQDVRFLVKEVVIC